MNSIKWNVSYNEKGGNMISALQHISTTTSNVRTGGIWETEKDTNHNSTFKNRKATVQDFQWIYETECHEQCYKRAPKH